MAGLTLGTSWDPHHLLRAANLEPNDAVYWHRLGLYEKWNFELRDLRRAISYYQRATETNPRSDKYWMDLADAYEAIGQTAPAQEAFERAQSAYPISSEVEWRDGNFLLRREDYSEAFAEIRRALVTDPNLTVQAVSECSKASNDLPRILTEVLPNQNRHYHGFLAAARCAPCRVLPAEVLAAISLERSAGARSPNTAEQAPASVLSTPHPRSGKPVEASDPRAPAVHAK